MNDLMIQGNTSTSGITMSSREIAELVGSRHDKVKQSIERLSGRQDSLGNPLIYLPPAGEYLDSMGRTAKEYLLGKRDSYVVVAQLSPEFTAKLIDRWQELEDQQSPQIPTTLSGALRLAADQAEQIEQQQKAIEQARPAVEFVDRYVASDSGSKGFRQVAKLLNAKENKLRQFLCDEKIMYRLAGEWMPYGSHIEAGRFEVKTGIADNEHAFNAAKFTAKGINWVAGKWAIHNLQRAA